MDHENNCRVYSLKYQLTINLYIGQQTILQQIVLFHSGQSWPKY